jgi:hypothetical protein
MQIFGKGKSKSFFTDEPIPIKPRKKGAFRVRPEEPPQFTEGYQPELSADEVLRGAKRRKRRR